MWYGKTCSCASCHNWWCTSEWKPRPEVKRAALCKCQTECNLVSLQRRRPLKGLNSTWHIYQFNTHSRRAFYFILWVCFLFFALTLDCVKGQSWEKIQGTYESVIFRRACVSLKEAGATDAWLCSSNLVFCERRALTSMCSTLTEPMRAIKTCQTFRTESASDVSSALISSC